MTLLEAISPTARTILKGGRARGDAKFDCVMAKCLARINDAGRGYLFVDGDDERLIRLSRWAHEVGDDALLLSHCREEEHRVQCWRNLQFSLRELVAFCLLWLTPGEPNYRKAIRAIQAERERQKELFREGRIGFDLSSSTPDVRRKFRVLFEECGDVALALDWVENNGMAWSNVKVELIHVAAVAVAWLESLEEAQ